MKKTVCKNVTDCKGVSTSLTIRGVTDMISFENQETLRLGVLSSVTMKSIYVCCFICAFVILNSYVTTCLPVNMCAGSRERMNVFQITVLETLTDAIPRLLQKFNVFIRKLGDFIRDLNEVGLRGDEDLLEAITSSESLDGFPDLNLSPTSGAIEDQLLQDYTVLLMVSPFVKHMYQLEAESDRQHYTSDISEIYKDLEDLICEFYTLLVNSDQDIPTVDNPSVLSEKYQELSTAGRHLYHYLVARDMQNIAAILQNRYTDL